MSVFNLGDACGSTLIIGRRWIHRGPGPTPRLLLVTVVEGAHKGVGIADLSIELDDDVLEDRLVGLATSGDSPDVVLSPG